VTPGATAQVEPTAVPTEPVVSSCRAEVSRQDVLPGEEIQYAIWVANAGVLPATSVILQDTISPGLELLRVSATQGVADVQGQTVTLRIGIIEPGQTVLALFDLRVGRSAVAGQVFLQQAVAFFDGGRARCNVVAAGMPPDHLPPTGAERRQP